MLENPRCIGEDELLKSVFKFLTNFAECNVANQVALKEITVRPLSLLGSYMQNVLVS